jgi:hypothetical protein
MSYDLRVWSSTQPTLPTWWTGVPHGTAHAVVVGEPYLALWPAFGVAQLAPQFHAAASSYTYPSVCPFETPRRGW